MKQIEGVKTAETSVDFQAGVDAAMNLVDEVIQAAIDRERMQKLEEALAELRRKYALREDTAPKRRGRKPKALPGHETALHEVE
jgi:hypothetical protein